MAQLPGPLAQEDLAWIWKGNCEPKIKFFMYLVWHDRIPHIHLLANRGMTHDASCPRCQCHLDHSAHVFASVPKVEKLGVVLGCL